MGAIRLILVWLGSVGIHALAGIVGLAALAGAAALAPVPALFVAIGLVTYLGSAAGLFWLVLRRRPDRARPWTVAAGTLALILVAAFSIMVLRPVDDPRVAPADVGDVQWWTLSDGSRIAYTHTPSDGVPEGDPIVFIHGGPAVADLAGDSSVFGRLTESGHDVYVYDQLGTGRSSRLDDPAGYTLGRWASNLEEIRKAIGAPRMILIGHSWGSRIAVHYASRHPKRVSKFVFSSPGAIPGSDDDSGGRVVDSLPADDRDRVMSLTLHPRMLLAYGLLQVDPVASHRFAGDEEMDARMDLVYNASRQAFHCPGSEVGPELHGLGFYAHQYPQSAGSPADPDLRLDLARLEIPILVVKARCDYLSWSSAIEYLDSIDDTTLVYFPDAGHNIYHDRPGAFLAVVDAFLAGDPVPGQRNDRSVPEGYLGPG